MGAQHLTQQEKAKLYEDMLFRYQRLQEEVRQIKAKKRVIAWRGIHRLSRGQSHVRLGETGNGKNRLAIFGARLW